MNEKEKGKRKKEKKKEKSQWLLSGNCCSRMGRQDDLNWDSR